MLFPDYLGYGSDAQHVHPYVIYPLQNVRTAIYLLNEAVSVLKSKYGLRNGPLPVVSTGYSEGGAYAVYFGACNTESLKKSLG